LRWFLDFLKIYASLANMTFRELQVLGLQVEIAFVQMVVLFIVYRVYNKEGQLGSNPGLP
jgi:hypothetical protein